MTTGRINQVATTRYCGGGSVEPPPRVTRTPWHVEPLSAHTSETIATNQQDTLTSPVTGKPWHACEPLSAHTSETTNRPTNQPTKQLNNDTGFRPR